MSHHLLLTHYDTMTECQQKIKNISVRDQVCRHLQLQIDHDLFCVDRIHPTCETRRPTPGRRHLSHRNTEICIFGPDRHRAADFILILIT